MKHLKQNGMNEEKIDWDIYRKIVILKIVGLIDLE